MRLPTIITIFVAQLSAVCWAQSPATVPTVPKPNHSGITLGPDTTVFSGPLLPDGSVDYVAALNAKEGQGITPETNAAYLLVRITMAGADPHELERRPEVLRLVGADNKPGFDVVWHKWNGFQHPLPTDNPDGPGYVDRFSLAKEHPWSSDDIPELAAWLTSNAPALAIAEEAVRQERYWMPIVHAPGDQNVLSVDHELSSTARLYSLKDGFCIRSMFKLQRGDASGALQDILILHHLATLAAQSPDISTLMAGTSLKGTACRASWQVLQDSRLSADQLHQWSASLLSLGPIPLRPHEIWHRSRCEFLSTVQFMAATETGELLKHMTANEIASARLLLPDWNRVLRQGNAFFDELDQHLSGLPENQRTPEEKAFDARFAKMVQKSSDADRTNVGSTPKWLFPQAGETREIYSDRIGAIILMITMPALYRTGESIRLSNTQVEWTATVGLALAIYRNEHKEYPPTLDALIPAYLSRLPDNPSGHPVGYERRDGGYVVRNVVAYPPAVLEFLSKRHLDYDPPDIIIQTRGH